MDKTTITSGFRKGDRTRLIRDCHDLRFGDTIFEAGATGILEQLYRVQDGKEVWSMRLDGRRTFGTFTIEPRIAVSHKDIEKV